MLFRITLCWVGRRRRNILIDKGYTRIACIAGPQDKTPARLRLEGYRKAMDRAGLRFMTGFDIIGAL